MKCDLFCKISRDEDIPVPIYIFSGSFANFAKEMFRALSQKRRETGARGVYAAARPLDRTRS